MIRQDRIRKLLTDNFNPTSLEIIDESQRHASHAQRQGLDNLETHFHVSLISVCFVGKSLVDRSRLVHEVLSDEFKSGLHALALSLKTPTSAV